MFSKDKNDSNCTLCYDHTQSEQELSSMSDKLDQDIFCTLYSVVNMITLKEKSLFFQAQHALLFFFFL